MAELFDFFSLPFMQRALLAGIMVGILASYYGVFIVQRNMSFLGGGLSHAAFGGVAIGLWLQTDPLYVAIPFTILNAFAITYVRKNSELSEDTVIGIFFALSMALGMVFLSLKQQYSADAFDYLFGSILTVTATDLWITLLVMVVTLFSLPRWSRWAYATFDPELARADGLKTAKDDYLLSILLGTTIAVSIKVVGILLIAAFLVIPPATARLVSRTFSTMTLVAVLLGALTSVIGLVFSYWFDLPGGATIILLQALLFFSGMTLGRWLHKSFP